MIKRSLRKIVDPSRKYLFNKGEYVDAPVDFFTPYGEDFIAVDSIPGGASITKVSPPSHKIETIPPSPDGMIVNSSGVVVIGKRKAR